MTSMGMISKFVSLLNFILLVKGDVFECMENGVNITSPTIEAVNTSSAIDHATIECLAACQASLLCQYWTLDVQNHICQLKETNTSMTYSETSISGKDSCHWCSTGTVNFYCNAHGCSAFITIAGDFCLDYFTIQVLGSDLYQKDDALSVYVDSQLMGNCTEINYTQGQNSSWFTCGYYPIDTDESFTVQLEDSTSTNSAYTIYGRVIYPDQTDLFWAATSCPNASEIALLESCSDVTCGEYCSAQTILPDGNTNYTINNCMADGKWSNIFIRICNYDKPTLEPTPQPPTATPSTRQPTTPLSYNPTAHPSDVPTASPTWSPTQHPTPGPTLWPTQRPTSKSNKINLKISKETLAVLLALSGILLYLCLFRMRRTRLNKALADVQIGLENRRLEYFDQCSSLASGERYKRTDLKEYSINDLQVGKVLGTGSVSEVKLVKIKVNSYFQKEWTEAAGKIINPRSGFGKKDFLKEVNLLNLVSNECDFIVNVIGIVMKPNNIILLEYYRNGTLDEALIHDYHKHKGEDGTKFPILRRLKFMLDLCQAVTHLQRHCIVHRDLATRNLLLSDDHDRVVLTDFGLARKINLGRVEKNETFTKNLPITKPPESCSNMKKVLFSLKTDVWGVAITIFEILNMRPLSKMIPELSRIEGTTAMKPTKMVLDDITLGKSFTRKNELWFITSKCWYKNPEQRPHIWEVEKVMADICSNPSTRDSNDRNYVREEFIDNQSDCGSEVYNDPWTNSPVLYSPPSGESIPSNLNYSPS